MALGQALTLPSSDSLDRNLSQVRAPDQRSVPLPKLALAATPNQDMLTGTLAPKACSELAPQPAQKPLTQQGATLPVISAGMLRQQFRHLQALQKQQQGARSGAMPLPATHPASIARHVPHQQPASGLALKETGPLAALQQQRGGLPRCSTPDTQHLQLAQGAASVGEARLNNSVQSEVSKSAHRVCRKDATQHLHNLAQPGAGPAARLCAQAAQASAAQAQAASTACADKHQGLLSALPRAAPRHAASLHGVWPECAAPVPGPPAYGHAAVHPAERLLGCAWGRANGSDVRLDSSATPRSVPGHPGSAGAHGSALASCAAVLGERPGHAPLHISAQPSPKPSRIGHKDEASSVQEGSAHRGFAMPADAAVTVQLLPARKPIAEPASPPQEPQVWRTASSLI